MKLMCKLFGHKYKKIKLLSGGDYPTYEEKCKKCDKLILATYHGFFTIINSVSLDESENVHSHEKWLDKHMD